MGDDQTGFDDAVAAYPFSRWQQSGLPQYTADNVRLFVEIFDDLIGELVRAGKDASESGKLDLIRHAVLRLNALSDRDDSLIETGEREELCALFHRIALACGLDPTTYGDGEGPASEWRTW